MSARRVAVITGASAGVGRATARAFADHGFDIALLARGEAGLEAAAAEVTKAGGRALCLPTDVSQFDQVDAAASRTERELGPIDVWVNDAMTTVFAPTWDVKPADFQRAVEVTFLGQVWGTMAALERMRPRDRGNIVNVGSALGIIGIPLQSAYCSSKFACRGFFESTRAELLHEGSHVQLSMVYLPAVNTPQFDWCATTLDRHPMPVPPIYQPELIAKFILEAALTGRREKVIGSWNKILVLAGAVPGAWQPVRCPGRLVHPAHQRACLRRPPGQPLPAGRRGEGSRRPRPVRPHGRRLPRPLLPEDPPHDREDIRHRAGPGPGRKAPPHHAASPAPAQHPPDPETVSLPG